MEYLSMKNWFSGRKFKETFQICCYNKGAMTNAHYRDCIVDQTDRSLKIALFVRANERNVMHIQWGRFANELLVGGTYNLLATRCTREAVNNASL